MSRILLVEDEANTAVPILSSLRRRGHEVEWAADADHAFACASRFEPEVLLCDVDLDGGLDGLQVIARLVEDRPELRAVVLTGTERERIEPRIERLPVAFVIRKPSTLLEIARAVEDVLERRTGDLPA